MQDTIKTSWVVIPEASAYVAVCLEYGFATCAKTMEDLPLEIGRFLCVEQLAAKQEGSVAFDPAQRAPEKYWEQYQKGTKLVMTIDNLDSVLFEGDFRLSNVPRLTADAC